MAKSSIWRSSCRSCCHVIAIIRREGLIYRLRQQGYSSIVCICFRNTLCCIPAFIIITIVFASAAYCSFLRYIFFTITMLSNFLKLVTSAEATTLEFIQSFICLNAWKNCKFTSSVVNVHNTQNKVKKLTDDRIYCKFRIIQLNESDLRSTIVSTIN